MIIKNVKLYEYKVFKITDDDFELVCWYTDIYSALLFIKNKIKHGDFNHYVISPVFTIEQQ